MIVLVPGTPSRKNKDGGYHDTDGFRKNNDGGYHDIDGYDNPDGGYSEVGAARKASLDNGIGLDDSDYKDIDTAFLYVLGLDISRPAVPCALLCHVPCATCIVYCTTHFLFRKGGTGVVEQSKVERSNPLFAAQQDNYFDIGDIENYEDGELGLYFDIGENGMALPKDFVDMYSSGCEVPVPVQLFTLSQLPRRATTLKSETMARPSPSTALSCSTMDRSVSHLVRLRR